MIARVERVSFGRPLSDTHADMYTVLSGRYSDVCTDAIFNDCPKRRL